MDVNGGSLSFVGGLDNSQLDSAVDETLRRVQGLSNGFVEAGDVLDKTTQAMVESIEGQRNAVANLENSVAELDAKISSMTPGDAQDAMIQKANALRKELDEERKSLVSLESEMQNLQNVDKNAKMSLEQVRQVIFGIGLACESSEKDITRLEAKSTDLGKQMSAAFMAGRDEEYNSLKSQQQAIQGEIRVRKQLMEELREQSNYYETVADGIKKYKKSTDDTAKAKVSLRSRIRELKEEMARLRMEGIDENSQAYKKLVIELGRLQDILGDVQTQGRIMANDQNKFAGLMSGLQGLTGGFTAASSAMSLFAGNNEDLQAAMLKTQQLMSILMGLQQVSQTLNKDSAFSLVTLTGLRQWWNKLIGKSRDEQTAETVAIVENTAATVANTEAKDENEDAQEQIIDGLKSGKAEIIAETGAIGANEAVVNRGTKANIGFAASFKKIGAAIKSVPVIGWLIAAITALIGLYHHFADKAAEAAKKQEEFYKAIADNCYVPIAKITELSQKWNRLADDMNEKNRFIRENKKAFDELGVAINNVAEAENLLNKGKDKFIQAQVEKAKAMAYFKDQEDNIKKLIKAEQEYANMPVYNQKWVRDGNDQFGHELGHYETDTTSLNQERLAKKKEIDKLNKDIQKGFTDAIAAETEGWKLYKEAGLKAIDQYEDGELGALEELIRQKESALKHLSNPTEYAAKQKEIADLQKKVDAITGGNKNVTQKDAFLEKLQKRKAEYERFLKWVNSGDSVLVSAANQEFASLLAEGKTYLDYLMKQRDELLNIDVSSRTKAQNQQLQTLNNQIAEQTKQTVLESFNKELNEQLANAKTITEMLNIIEQRRKELANADNSDLNNGKNEALDEAESKVREQAKSEVESLLEEYAGYVQKKKRLEEEYQRDIALLAQKRLSTTNEDDLAAIDAAIDNRKKRYSEDDKSLSPTPDYDKLLADFGNFEQKKKQLVDEYDKKRQVAENQGDEDMIKRLNDAQAKAISKLASSELTDSTIWEQLFGNLDDYTASQITTLVNEIDSQFSTLSGVFNPVDLNAIRTKLNEAKAILYKDNPFKQLGVAIKDIFNNGADDSKDSAEKIKRNWKKLADSTEACFEFVNDAVNSCDILKDAIGDVGTTAINSMMMCATTAVAVATAIKTAERASVVLAIIQAALVAVQAVANFVKSIFGNKDAQIEKQISKWKESVDDLKNAYTQLAWEIDKTLGSAIYKNQKAAIANMQQQQAYLRQMWLAEESKKKADDEKVRDYKEQYAQLERDIKDMLDEIAEDILQTNAKDFATQLGDALVDAFAKGEDAAGAFETTVNEILKNAIVNQLKKQFLETQLQGALDNLTKSMGYWAGDSFIFDGLTDTEIAAFKSKVQAAADNYSNALEIYSELFKDLVDDDADTSLSGAVKGVTEQTADVIAGQMNAIRINQIESAEILRQQLQTLNTIANNTSYCALLQNILNELRFLKSQWNDSARSQGLV